MHDLWYIMDETANNLFEESHKNMCDAKCVQYSGKR